MTESSRSMADVGALIDVCASKTCARPLDIFTAWQHEGARYCSLGCVAGACPACGRDLRAERALWLVSVEGTREIFCSQTCAEARSAEERAREAALHEGWRRSLDLFAALHAVALLNGIAMALFATDEQVLKHVARRADLTLEGRFSVSRSAAIWRRAWELDADGGRTRAIERVRLMRAVVRVAARGLT